MLAQTGCSRSGSSWPCSGWGLPSHPSRLGCWWSLTPPFHPYPHSDESEPLAVCSLWHFPASCLGWVLPTTLPGGVRTFLGTSWVRRNAVARPACPRISL